MTLTRYFGIPLREIVKWEKNAVPSILINVTAHLCKQGIDVVGIFRPNGNAKMLDRLRSSYNKTGDADLRSCTDAMTVGALLKVFLRELPDGLIPQNLTAQFVAAQDICIKDPNECLRVMRELLQQLPKENYATLKYLIAFLVLVTLEEEVNKMSAMALAIVFGPAMFRCASGFEGLKEQGVTNYITLTFIMKYDVLFLEDGEISPYSPEFILSDCCKNVRLPNTDVHENGVDSNYDDEDSLCSPCSPTSPPLIDSESSEASSVMASSLSAALQRAIRHAVCRHVFGEVATSSSDEAESSCDSDHSHSSVRYEDIESTIKPKTGKLVSPVVSVVPDVVRGSQPVNKPAMAVASNTVVNVLRSNSVSAAGVSSSMKAAETSSSSAEDSDTGSESPPPPILPRLPASKPHQNGVGAVQSKSKVPDITHKTAITSMPRNASKSRLPSPPNVLRHPAAPLHESENPDIEDEAVADSNTATFRKLSKQIKAAKRRIKEFETDFEEEHGFKPSLSDKVSYPEIKKCMSEVTSARRRLAELRLDSNTVKTSNQKDKDVHAVPSVIENTLALLLRKLSEKRRESHRPEEISRMTIDDLKEEKTCLQKALLHFETLHGRPSSLSEKQLMHPLYERYRKIKRILESASDNESDDGDVNNVGGSSDHGSANPFVNTSFLSSTSTQNTLSSVRTENTMKTVSVKSSTMTSRTHTTKSRTVDRNGSDSSDGHIDVDSFAVNMATMSMTELLAEIERTQEAKKQLQIELHNYEQSFIRKYGRRLQREDRRSRELEYKQYKVVKSKLKLLEALLEKRNRSKKHVVLPNGL